MHPAVRETIWFRNVQNQQRRSSDGARKKKEMVKKKFLLVEINFTKKLQTFVSSQCISLATWCNMYISYALKQFKRQYIFHLDYQTICPLCKPFIKYPQLKYEMKCMTWRILILSFSTVFRRPKLSHCCANICLSLPSRSKLTFSPFSSWYLNPVTDGQYKHLSINEKNPVYKLSSSFSNSKESSSCYGFLCLPLLCFQPLLPWLAQCVHLHYCKHHRSHTNCSCLGTLVRW